MVVAAVRPAAEGRMDLCIPAADPPIMLARVAYLLCVDKGCSQVSLVWALSTSPPCEKQ